MIELLVVVIIIAILIALLIPAVMAAVRAARSAAVNAEIQMLAQSIADFKSKFGDYPPSRILLREDGFMPTSLTGSANTVSSGGNPSIGNSVDVSIGVLAQRTVTAFRKFWPRVQLSTTGPVWAALATPPPLGSHWYDFNGNGLQEQNTFILQGHESMAFVLQGNECLTFFLGGIPLNANGLYSMTGFGKSPTNPFSNGIAIDANYSGNPNPMYGANRNAPLFDFDSNRLVATTPTALQTVAPVYAVATLSGVPGYIDSLGSSTLAVPQNFYAYFSTNVGSGYDPNDVNFEESDSLGTGPICLQFFPTQPVGAASLVSPSPNPYTTTVPFGGSSVTFSNPQSFQIVSPGADSTYGVGGTCTRLRRPPRLCLLRTDSATAPTPGCKRRER